MIYHGVLNSCNGFVYRFGVALLDHEKPWIVKERGNFYVFGPEESYELTGDVPNVTFPCATLTDADTGRHHHLLWCCRHRHRHGLHHR